MRSLRAAIPEDAVGVRGKVYSVRGFDHPGGDTFLKMVRGKDATALFETHHVDIHAAEAALRRLEVRGEYEEPHGYDFEEYARLRDLAKREFFPNRASRRMKGGEVARMGGVVLLTAAAHVGTLAVRFGTAEWVGMCACAAYLNSVCGGYGHNAVHRLHPCAVLLDWNGLSCYEWLFEHIQSHHMYVNTECDHDSIAMEPFLRWLPGRKECVLDAHAAIGKHVVYAIAEVSVAIQGNLVHRTRWRPVWDADLPAWMRVAPMVFVVRMLTYVAVRGWAEGALTALATLGMAGYLFAYLAHLSHPFGGEGRPSFLRHQLRNTKDMHVGKGVEGDMLLFLDRQTLHHLFPSVDHTRLTREVRSALSVGDFMRPRTVGRLNTMVNEALGGGRAPSHSKK